MIIKGGENKWEIEEQVRVLMLVMNMGENNQEIEIKMERGVKKEKTQRKNKPSFFGCSNLGFADPDLIGAKGGLGAGFGTCGCCAII